MSRVSVTAVASSSSSLHLHSHHHQDDLWQMNMRSSREQQMETGGPYPVREGESDCSYYIRTGLCRFGTSCRFNHPPNRNLAIATARVKGEYPERIGQLECQYYLRTGTCKFGATCKFHHPRDKAGVSGKVALNILGYPLRPNETECAYYMRNGQCKFGSTCKFHHPQPSNAMVSLRGAPVYRSPTTGQLAFPLSRASLITSPRWQSPSSYGPLFMPQGLVWNTYSGQVGPVSSSENPQTDTHNDRSSRQVGEEAVNMGYHQYRSSGSSVHMGVGVGMGYYTTFKRENVFPERPGEPECEFYLKTGDCKFGAVCKFHHPRQRLVPVPDCFLSPIGLPLRPGEAVCVFYSRYGICKFGPSCKFDHPMRIFASNASSSSSISISPHAGGRRGGGRAVVALPDEHVGAAGPTNNRPLSDLPREKPPAVGINNNIDKE